MYQSTEKNKIMNRVNSTINEISLGQKKIIMSITKPSTQDSLQSRVYPFEETIIELFRISEDVP